MARSEQGPQIDPLWMEEAPIRKEYREERESELRADLDATQAAAIAAADLAQSIIKAGFLLNGGGIIAIPAIVTLFSLDARRQFGMLLATGGAFIVGLLVTWFAAICTFFALSNMSDARQSAAVKTARLLEAKYFPHRKADMDAQAKEAAETAERHRRRFVGFRIAAIVLCFAAVVAFIVGVGVGGIAVLKLPPKPTMLAT